MALALGTTAVILLVLVSELTRPRLKGALAHRRMLSAARWRGAAPVRYDPGRERRAEQRARALLRSCVDERDWAIYRDLGFLRVTGRLGEHAHEQSAHPGSARYAYLIYPHKPIVAYVPDTGELLNEYCVAFPDDSKPYGSSRLPDSDDVLAKWMALRGDERRLLLDANMHLPGRQVDPDRVRRDIARLTQWERERNPGETPVRAAASPVRRDPDNVRAA